MPAKSKLPRNKVPPKLPAPKVETQQNSTSATQSNLDPPRTASGLDQEAEDQFELELCWCIQQLEAGLTEKKLQDKQVYNMTKSLNVLKSHNASLIRKRQVMRNTFGDYRSKMVDEEKKFAKTAAVVKFAPFENKKLEKKSVFFKKANTLSTVPKEQELSTVSDQTNKKAIINPDVSSEPFKFNFSQSDEMSEE